MVLRAWSVVLISMMVLACTAKLQRAEPETLPDTGRPAMHAVTDADLRILMRQMNSLMFDQYKTGPELDKERRLYAKRIVELADTLAASSAVMSSKLSALDLKPDEQVTFKALGNKLREQAGTLKTQAQLNRIDELEQTQAQIKQTCTSCHSLFRSLED